MPKQLEEIGFLLTRAFASTRPTRRNWPYVPGKYFVNAPDAPVAVTTLGSVGLAGEIAERRPEGLCIVGKVETENIGIEKIVKNVVSNPAIRFLVCAGNEPPKHLTGATILALFEHGIDREHRIIGSPGARPVLPNTSLEEVEAFRGQVEPIDMIGCIDAASIHSKVGELLRTEPKVTGKAFTPPASLAERDGVDHVTAEGTDPKPVRLDRAGYFVIHIQGDALLVEHYSYEDQLLRVIEGQDARSIYLTIVRNGWASRLDHAAYLGKELARAELSIAHGFEFTQDGG